MVVGGVGICTFLGHLIALHLDFLVSNGIVQFRNVTTGALVIFVLNAGVSFLCEVTKLLV